MMLLITATCFGAAPERGASRETSLSARTSRGAVRLLPPDTVASRPVMARGAPRNRPGSRSTRRESVRQRLHEPGLQGLSFPVFRTRSEAVFFLEPAGGNGRTFGVLLALVWTAGSSVVSGRLKRRCCSPTRRATATSTVGISVRWHRCVSGRSLSFDLGWSGLRPTSGTSYWRVTCCFRLQLQSLKPILIAGITQHGGVGLRLGAFWLLGWAINYGWRMKRGVLERARSLRHAGIGGSRVLIFPKPTDAGLIVFTDPGAIGDSDKPTVFRLS